VSAKLALLQNFGFKAGWCGFANVPMWVSINYF